MILQAVCTTCKKSYLLGDLSNLPQSSRLTRTMGDLLHGHVCKASEKRLDTLQLSA